MLLTTLALVSRKVGKLPTRRSSLYTEAVAVLLNWNPRHYQPIDEDEAIPQLGYIAYEMCRRGVQQLPEDDVLDLLDQLREEFPNIRALRSRSSAAFLEHLEARSGILMDAGGFWKEGVVGRKAVWEFRHLTFQEFLASRALLKGRYPGRQKSQSLAEHVAPLARTSLGNEDQSPGNGGDSKPEVSDSWRETLRLTVSDCSDDDADDTLLAVLRPLEDENQSQALRPRAILAGLCLADEPNVSDETASQVMTALVESGALKEMSRQERVSVEDTIAALSESAFSPLLKSLLVDAFCEREGDSRTEVSSLFAGGLANAGQHELDISWADHATVLNSDDRVETICALFMFDGHSHVEAGRRRPPNLLPGEILRQTAIIVRLLDEPDSCLKVASALGLSRLFSALGSSTQTTMPNHILEAIVRALQSTDSSDPDCRLWLVNALGNSWNLGAREPLITALLDDDTNVRSSAAFALGNLGSERAIDPLISALSDNDADRRSRAADALRELGAERAVDPLISALSDDKPNVRTSAAFALGELGAERAVDPLISALSDDVNFVRSNVASALGKLDSERAVDPLISALSDDVDFVRSSAAFALENLGSERAIDPLISALSDNDADGRSSTAKALGDLGAGRAVDPLISALSDDKPNVRSSAAFALGKLDSERAVDPLISALLDDKPNVRSSAANALGKLGFERAVDPLISALSDDKPDVRSSAANALGKLGFERAVDPLISALSDDKPNVRSHAADALRELGAERAIDPLISALSDNDAIVRSDAAYALRKLGAERAVDPLISALSDDDVSVRSSAAYTLGNLGAERAVDPLISALSDNDTDGRSSAANALGELGFERAVDPLISTLSDDDSFVRFFAAGALGKFGSERVALHLRPLLADCDPLLRARSALVLTEFGDESADHAISALLQHHSKKVRSKIPQALAFAQLETELFMILSVDFDGSDPWIDPKEPVSKKRISDTAKLIGGSIEDARILYESVASILKLEFE